MVSVVIVVWTNDLLKLYLSSQLLFCIKELYLFIFFFSLVFVCTVVRIVIRCDHHILTYLSKVYCMFVSADILQYMNIAYIKENIFVYVMYIKHFLN